MAFKNELDLEISRVIKAPPAAVWKAWTKPEYMEQWWAPKPVVLTLQRHELHVGGGVDWTMRLEDGTEYKGEFCFLELMENQRIVMTDALKSGWRLRENPLFTAIVTLEEHPQGTLYTALAMHRTPEDCKKHADMGFDSGWGTVMEQLDDFVQQF